MVLLTSCVNKHTFSGLSKRSGKITSYVINKQRLLIVDVERYSNSREATFLSGKRSSFFSRSIIPSRINARVQRTRCANAHVFIHVDEDRDTGKKKESHNGSSGAF